MSSIKNIPPYNTNAVFKSYQSLQLLNNHTNHDGDIYDISDFDSPKLICTSGPKIIKIQRKGDINEFGEEIEEMIPSYDGTVIRIFNFNNEWFFSTKRQLKAEDGSWPPFRSKKTFKEVFEEFCKFENFDIYLNSNKSYTFLLLSNSIQNVLPNSKNELFLISIFNQKDQSFTSKPLPMDRPPWADQIVNSSICGQYVTTQNSSTTTLKIVRPQRGFLYYTNKGNVYQMDFQFFIRWESVIQNKPWQIVFYEMLKLQATRKQMSISLQEFCNFYAGNGIYDFNKQIKLLTKISDVISFWDSSTSEALRKNYLLNSIFHTICAKNKSELIPTHAFILRQIAFLKYSFLDELFTNENMNELFEILNNIIEIRKAHIIKNKEWETL